MDMSNNGGAMDPSTFLAMLQAQQRQVMDMMAYVFQRNNSHSGYVFTSAPCQVSSNEATCQ